VNQHIIENKYDLKVSEIKLLDKHFGTELHLISTQTGKYIVKVLPLYMENVKNEGELTEYLYNHGIQVARFLKSKNDTYVVKMSEYQFTVQQFIDGKSLLVNTAPDWFLCKSADFLGQTVLLLKDYKDLPLRFGRGFFSSKTVCRKIRQYQKELVRAKKAKDWDIVPAWENQIRYQEERALFQRRVYGLMVAHKSHFSVFCAIDEKILVIMIFSVRRCFHAGQIVFLPLQQLI